MRYSEFQLRAWAEPNDRVQVLVHSSPAGNLRREIVRSYSADELHRLISDLKEDLVAAGIDPLGWLDPGSGPAETQVLNLLEVLDSRGLLGYLLAALRRDRPEMNWPLGLAAAPATSTAESQ